MNEIEKFYNLEDALQDAILSEKTALTVYDLGEQNGLKEEVIGKIGYLTKRVLMKDFSIKDFKTSLELEVGLDFDLASKIGDKIEEEIFEPVKVLLFKRDKITKVPQKKEDKNAFEKQSHMFKDNYRENSEE